jgi:CRP/FNR family transcriptional activator FtrB
MPDIPSTLDLARRTELFQSIGEGVFTRLLRGSIVQLVPRGTTIFHEGEPADFVHFILAGCVGLMARAGTAEETVLTLFGEGDLAVVPAAVLAQPLLVSGVVVAEARILFIPAETFRAALDLEPRLCRAVLDHLARHLRLLIGQLTDLKLLGSRDRVLRYLRLRAEGGSTVVLREPKQLIARLLGMSPESLSRALAALEAEGVLRVEGQRVEFTGPEG